MWMQFRDHLSEDFSHNNQNIDADAILSLTLNAINSILQKHSKSWGDFPGLPPLPLQPINLNVAQIIAEETNYPHDLLQVEVDQLPQLNNEQRHVFDIVSNAVLQGDGNAVQKLFFLDGVGKFILMILYLSI